MSASASRAPGLGPAGGDPDLIARVEPLLREAGLRDRASVVHVKDRQSTEAHFGAGARHGLRNRISCENDDLVALRRSRRGR